MSLITEEKLSSHSHTRVQEPVGQRRASGFVRLLGISGLTMSLLLPLGVVPRILQTRELDQTERKIEQTLPAVSTTKAVYGDADYHVSLPGTIEAILDAPIYARSNGYVAARLVDIGDRVRANQLLADIQTPEVDDTAKEASAQVLTNVAVRDQNLANRARAAAELQNLKAQLAQSRASLIESQATEKLALSTYKRYKTLGREGAVSLQDVDERETAVKTAQAARQAAEERVSAAESAIVAAQANLNAQQATVNVSEANIKAAQARENRSADEKSFSKVVSPFAGVITERNIEQGSLVSSGSDSSRTPMYKLARIDTVKAFVDVPQYAAAGIKVGMPVNVKLKEFPARTFKGKVARTSVALDPAARTLRTEIHIPNNDLVLAPGMYADVEFVARRAERPVIVPANAVSIRAEGPQVVVVNADKKTEYKKVALGNDLGTQIEVLSGLKPGQEVVINPPDSLQSGASVNANSVK